MRIHFFPIVVWLAAVAGVVVLFMGRAEKLEVIGIAQANTRIVTANCAAKVRDLSVGLFDKVDSGQTVVVLEVILEPRDFDRKAFQLAQATTEIQRLMADLVLTQEELLAEASDRESDDIVAKRRFSIDVEQARLRILELRTLIESDRILLGDAMNEVKIAAELFEEDAIAVYELQKAQIQHDAIAIKIAENQQFLEQAYADFNETKLRYDLYAQRVPFSPSVESALEVVRKEIRAQEELIKTAMTDPAPIVLTSPLEGVVSQIQRMPGETVQPGEPILIITQAQSSDVIVYANQAQAAKVKEGMPVELISGSDPTHAAKSHVAKISPEISPLPERLWQTPDVNEYGRQLMIKIPPGMNLIPGEIVAVRGL